MYMNEDLWYSWKASVMGYLGYKAATIFIGLFSRVYKGERVGYPQMAL
jgi:hypothetical protein